MPRQSRLVKRSARENLCFIQRNCWRVAPFKSKMAELGNYNGNYQSDKIKIRLEGTSNAVESAVAFLRSTMEIIDDFEMDNGAANSVRRYVVVRLRASAPRERLLWDNQDN